METSYLYIITDGQAFKVGISKEPTQRLKSLQTSNPNKLEIIEVYAIPSSLIFKFERECHKEIQTKFVKRGEWFWGASPFHLRLIIEEILERFVPTS